MVGGKVMAIQFAKGIDGDGDPACLLCLPAQDSINECEWIEMGRLMGWSYTHEPDAIDIVEEEDF
jgi:hypothetical protein